jgi:hypothetical protein
MSLNRDFEEIYEFYVQSLIDTIGETNPHIDTKELRTLWKGIKNPHKDTKTKREKTTLCHGNIENEKRKTQLEASLMMMKYDDLCRHCLRNGIQPPNNREDMIKAIITKTNL